MDRVGVVVTQGAQATVITVILIRVAQGVAGTALEVRRNVTRKQGMFASVPTRVGREAKARDGRAEALAQVDQILHLVDPLALTSLVLEPDLDHSLGKTGVFGQFFEYFWRRFWVLVKTVL